MNVTIVGAGVVGTNLADAFHRAGHAVTFGAKLRHLDWQTSDLDENHAAIAAWIAESALANVREPLSVDVRTASVSKGAYDAAYSSNTAHIMSYPAVEKMFADKKMSRPRILRFFHEFFEYPKAVEVFKN